MHMRMEDAIEKYFEVATALRGMADLTVVSYTSDFRDANRFFLEQGISEISEISNDVITDYLVSLRRRGLNSSTIHRRKNALSSLFVFAVQRGWIETNPVSGVALQPKLRKTRDTVLSHDQIRKILTAKAQYRSVCDATINLAKLLVIFTAMRSSEIIKADLSHVDLNRELLTVYNSKNTSKKGLPRGKDRDIPLCRSVIQALEALPYKDGPLLQTTRGRRLSDDALRRIIARACIEAGLEKMNLTPHHFRHSLSSQLIMVGYSEADVSLLLGHLPSSVTQSYIHSSLERIRDALQKYDDIIMQSGGQNVTQFTQSTPVQTALEVKKGANDDVLGEAKRWWMLLHGGVTSVPEDFVLGFFVGRRSKAP